MVENIGTASKNPWAPQGCVVPIEIDIILSYRVNLELRRLNLRGGITKLGA